MMKFLVRGACADVLIHLHTQKCAVLALQDFEEGLF